MQSGIAWSHEQNIIFEGVDENRRNMFIDALAGTGKTTTLIELTRRIPRNSTILFCAFNRDIVQELKNRLPMNVRCNTFHSIGFTALKSALGVTNLESNGHKYREIVTDWADKSPADLVFALTAAVNEAAEDNPNLDKDKFAKDLAKDTLTFAVDVINWLRFKLIDWQDERGLIEMINQYDLDEDILQDEGIVLAVVNAIPHLMDIGEATTRDSNIDFTDMIYWPVYWGSRFRTYEYVMVDEAQDLSPMQRAMVARCLSPSGRIFLVGDKHQAIYAFAGADADSYQLSIQKWNCVVYPLTITRRCAKLVTQHAAQLVPDFKCPPEKEQGRIVWLDESLLVGAVKPGDFIVCRLKAPLVGAVLDLIAAGIPATILGSEIGKQLVGIIDKLMKRNNWAFSALGLLLDEYQAENVDRYSKHNDQSKIDSLNDQMAALRTIITRVKPESAGRLIESIEGLFSERAGGNQLVTLSTIHKVKGKEAKRVFILAPDKLPLMGYDGLQENNLDYVARTRAINTLVYLTNKRFTDANPKPYYATYGFSDELPPAVETITVEKEQQLALPASTLLPNEPQPSILNAKLEAIRVACDGFSEETDVFMRRLLAESLVILALGVKDIVNSEAVPNVSPR